MKKLLLAGTAALSLTTGATALDLSQVFPQGAVLDCGDIKMSKLPDGKMQTTDAAGRPKYGVFPITVKDNQIFLYQSSH